MMAAVSVALSPLQANCTSAREALAELAASREELERFLAEVLGHLESLWGQLEERESELASQRQRLELESRRRSEELNGRSEEQGRRKRTRRNELRRGIAAATAEFAEAMVHQRFQMAEERAKWHEELTQMRRLLETLAGRQTNSSTK